MIVLYRTGWKNPFITSFPKTEPKLSKLLESLYSETLAQNPDDMSFCWSKRTRVISFMQLAHGQSHASTSKSLRRQQYSMLNAEVQNQIKCYKQRRMFCWEKGLKLFYEIFCPLSDKRFEKKTIILNLKCVIDQSYFWTAFNHVLNSLIKQPYNDSTVKLNDKCIEKSFVTSKMKYILINHQWYVGIDLRIILHKIM